MKANGVSIHVPPETEGLRVEPEADLTGRNTLRLESRARFLASVENEDALSALVEAVSGG